MWEDRAAKVMAKGLLGVKIPGASQTRQNTAHNTARATIILTIAAIVS